MKIFQENFDKPIEFFSKIWEDRTGQAPDIETSIKFKENFLESLNVATCGAAEDKEVQIDLAMVKTNPSTIGYMDKDTLCDNPQIIDAALYIDKEALRFIPEGDRECVQESYNYARGIIREWNLQPLKLQKEESKIKLPPCSNQYWPELNEK